MQHSHTETTTVRFAQNDIHTVTVNTNYSNQISINTQNDENLFLWFNNEADLFKFVSMLVNSAKRVFEGAPSAATYSYDENKIDMAWIVSALHLKEDEGVSP